MSFSSLFVISGLYEGSYRTEDVYHVLISFMAGLSAWVSKIFFTVPPKLSDLCSEVRTWQHKVAQLGWDCLVFSISQARSISINLIYNAGPSFVKTDRVQAGLPEQGLIEISADSGM